jgi:hypothetical protein
MSSETTECWRPTWSWLLRGGAISFLIGAVVGALVELGSARFDVANLAWSGLVGLFIFLIVCSLLTLLLDRSPIAPAPR